MAEDRVDVVFGARVGELLAGVAESKEAIEGLRAPIDAFIGNLGGIAEVVGAAFAVEKIAEFTEKMAELGEKTMNAAAAIGTTPEQFSELSVTMALAGGNAETALRAMEMLGSHLVEAINNPASRAAAALRDLGISQAQAKRATTDLDYAWRLLSDAFVKSEPGFARTADFKALIARGFDVLIPLLRRGAEGYDEFKKKAGETGAVLDGPTLSGMEHVKEHLNTLGQDLQGLGVSAWKLFGDAINKTIGELDFIIKAIKEVIDWLLQLRTAIDNAFASFDRFVGRANTTGQTGADIEREGGSSAMIPKGGPAHLRHLTGPDTGKGAKGGSDERMSIWRDELRQQLQDEEHFFNDSKREELAFWQAKLAIVGGGSKEDLKLRREVNAQIFTLQKGLAKQTQKDAIEEQTYAQKVDDLSLAYKRAYFTAEASLGKLNAQELITIERQLLDEKLRADEDYYHKKEAAASKDSETVKKLEEEEYLNYQKIQNEKLDLDVRSAEATKSSVEGIIAPLKSAVGNAAVGVAMGTQTLRQAGSNIGQAALAEIINKSMSILFDKLIVQTITNLVTQITADGTNTGILAGLLAAIFAKPSVAGTTFGQGGIVSARHGWVVPSAAGGMLINAHQGEAVLPEHWTKGLDAMFRGGQGGGDNHLHVHAVNADAASMNRWFKGMVQQNPKAVGGLFKSNALTPRNS